jgi:hypothetical protein
MKYSIIKILMAFLVIIMTTVSLQAEMVSREEALTIAKNWVRMVTNRTGAWAGSKSPIVYECVDFKRGDRFLGYWCPVEPAGYVVLSPLKEITPIVAYSDEGNLDPTLESGKTGAFKHGLEKSLDEIEKRLGPMQTAKTKDLLHILETDYRQSWEQIKNGVNLNYQEGGTLLTSRWHQKWPYDSLCPPMECADPELNGHAPVGALAVATAQILRYWAWPPYTDIYYCQAARYDPGFWDMLDFISSATSPYLIYKVAKLHYEASQSIGTTYTECSAIASLDTLQTNLVCAWAFHGNVDKREVDDCENLYTWWSWIVNELNWNRPIPYANGSYAVVIDGWREIVSPYTREVHVNHGDSTSGWVNVGFLYIPGAAMLVNVFPARWIQPPLTGVYSGYPGTRLGEYYYFGCDASGANAVFRNYQNQLLRGITVSNNGSDSIRFEVPDYYHPFWETENSRIFAGSDPERRSLPFDTPAGIHIDSGSVVQLKNNGAIKFPRWEPVAP